MQDEEILKKAIEKARGNGYRLLNTAQDTSPGEPCYYRDFNTSMAIIFSHDFAKAFWGGEAICSCCNRSKKDSLGNPPINDNTPHRGAVMGAKYISSWEYHLQQTVLKEDPIKYLEQFLTEE